MIYAGLLKQLEDSYPDYIHCDTDADENAAWAAKDAGLVRLEPRWGSIAVFLTKAGCDHLGLPPPKLELEELVGLYVKKLGRFCWTGLQGLLASK